MQVAPVFIPQFPFQNRDVETAALRAFLFETNHPSRIGLVEGRPGIGKTQLLRFCLEQEQNTTLCLWVSGEQSTSGMTQLAARLLQEIERKQRLTGYAGRAWERMSQRNAAIELLIKALASLPGGPFLEEIAGRILPPPTSNGSWLELAGESLRELAATTHTTVVFDDIQWLNSGDQAQLTDLLSIVSDQKHKKLRMIVSVRTGMLDQDSPLGRALRTLSGEGLVLRIPVGPLSEEDLQSITADLFGHPGQLTQVIRQAAGNPEWMRQAIVELNLLGNLESSPEGLSLSAGVPLSPIGRGWLQLANETTTRRVLGVLAVGPRYFSSDLMKSLRAQDLATESAVLEAVDSLKNHGLIDEQEGPTGAVTIGLSHDTLREQIRYELRSSYPLEYIVCQTALAEAIEHRLDLVDISLVEKFKMASDISCELPSEAFPYLADFIRLAIAAREAARTDWPIIGIAATRLTGRTEAHSDLLDVGGPLLKWMDERYSDDSPLKLKIQQLVVKALFETGRYNECAEAAKSSNDALILYYSAAAQHMQNRNASAQTTAEIALANLRGDPREHLKSLLISLRAIAVLEQGDHDAAERIYASHLPTIKGKTSGEGRFLYMAPHFLSPKEAVLHCNRAYRFFSGRNKIHAAAMAENNLGYGQLLLGNLSRARHSFRRATERLLRMTSHEAAYPLNNLGAVLILRGEYHAALEKLEPCLFLRIAPHPELSIRLNMYLARVFGGAQPNRLQKERIRTLEAKLRDPWMAWITELVLVTCQLESASELNQQTLDQLRDMIVKLRFANEVVPFWNSLNERLARRHSISPRYLKSGHGNSSQPFSIKSIIRPSLLCFGH